MHNKFPRQIILMGLIALLCSSCSHIQHYKQQTQYSYIERKITLSTLDKVNEYTSRTPYQKTYEFEFNNSEENAYTLIFYLSESSFSRSIIKHRDSNELHRDAIRIDDSKNILAALNKYLPHADRISWQQVANHVTADEARDGYHVMQEYIRLKIRDL